MHRSGKPAEEKVGMFGGDPGDQNPAAIRQDGVGDGDHLFRRFSRPVDDFRKTLPERSLQIDRGKTQFHDGRSLERVKDVVAGNLPLEEFVEEECGFG
jgi:hypothetical protein